MKPVNMKLSSKLEAELTKRMTRLRTQMRRDKGACPPSMLTISNLLRLSAQHGLETLLRKSDADVLRLIAATGMRRGGKAA